MGKSKSKTVSNTATNQTQTATPYGPIQSGLDSLAGNITHAMDMAQATPMYTGDFVAQPGALQSAVIPAYQQSAALANSLINPALTAANTKLWEMPTFGGPSIDAGTKTFGSYDASQVAPVIEAAMAPYLRQLQEQILPGLQSSAIESGAYSNDRAFAVMPQTALRDTSRMAAEVGSGIAFQDFLEQQNRLQQAYGLSTQRGLGTADVLTSRLGLYPELTDNVMRLSTGSADLTQQASAYDLAMRQAEINNALARDQYAISAPFRGLDQAASLYGTFAPYATQNMTGTSNSTQTTTTKPSLAGQIMQGAIGLGSMAMGMPGGLGGMFGSAGSAAAAAAPMMMANPFQALPQIPMSSIWNTPITYPR